MDRIIEVQGLKKSYGSVEAVKGIDFYVERGALFAFLGPNGAGKSTTIDMVSTLLKPDAGSVTVDGKVLGRQDGAIRSRIGIVFQDSVLDGLLTVKENLMSRGSLYGMPGAELKKAVQNAAEVADVTEFWNRPYGKLSGGQRRRADIARALVNTPRILFLDEPTTGLDPQTRKRVWETVKGLQKQNDMTIFLTTHYMEEAAQADYITIMDSGSILARGTPLELKEQYARDSLRIKPKDMARLEALLKEKGVEYRVKAQEAVIRLSHTVEAIPLIDALRGEIDGFEVVRGSMDDVFINLTGREVRD